MTLPRSALLLAVLLAACGEHQGPGEPTQTRLPAELVGERAGAQRAAATALAAEPGAAPATQILFGDLHVHTTFSADAFIRSLPMLQGEGVHPPADACDFARFCSAIDFWSITDHAEAISPRHWQETRDAIRQCNAIAGDPKNPDVVAFLGWEWTQVGVTPEQHYGHKNVILRHTEDDKVPARPIAALSPQLLGTLRRPPPLRQRITFPILDWPNRQRYFDFGQYVEDLSGTPICPDGVDVRQLPADCTETTPTPQGLFEKLNQWGHEAIVIPHGTTWGFYTPPGSKWDKQLTAAQHDPQRQTLIEVFSGHGNSEEYRAWRDVDVDAQGRPVCPEPTTGYEPCCWRAGEIVRSRCGALPADECARRVEQARADYLSGGAAGRLALPGTTIDDWKDCGQCRDCFAPSFNYRPKSSVQYIMALTNPAPGQPRNFEMGFVASSDNHTARPGTGYKEYGRRMMTEASGARDEVWDERITLPDETPAASSHPVDPENLPSPAFLALDLERQASFFMTGGLVAVHAAGRDRDAIWDALRRREVYGTSGERILLWFDLLNGPHGVLPMGAKAALARAPRFRVRAVGSFKQKPGCPAVSTRALSPERLEYLCRGECYNPSDERHRITRVEVVRIRRQQRAGEPVETLVDDPWKTLPCPGTPAGCVVEFDDPGFASLGRDVLYYVRAIQEPTLAVNGKNLRCEYDAQGACVKTNPCFGDYRTPFGDDCLSPVEERAWSSPIFLGPAA